MPRYAITSRVLQFKAGPNEHRFFACDRHASELEKTWPVDLFFSTNRDKIESVDPSEELKCDFCREG